MLPCPFYRCSANRLDQNYTWVFYAEFEVRDIADKANITVGVYVLYVCAIMPGSKVTFREKVGRLLMAMFQLKV